MLDGLSSHPPRLPPRLFYDDVGSRLFDRITRLQEYYPTRTELSILNNSMDEIASLIGPGISLIEFGSGSSEKTEILLEGLASPFAYLPVDISRTHLLDAAKRIAADMPDLTILPVCADYNRPIPALATFAREHRAVIFFPGSTIGNFEPTSARDFLGGCAQLVGTGGGILIGFDLPKDPRILERAYNDSEGVTAAFNLNMLTHINRSLGPVFDVDRFSHRAIWKEAESRIEMHLVPDSDQVVSIDGRSFVLPAGKPLVTEHCYKYATERSRGMLAEAGFDVAASWTDPASYFEVVYATIG